MKGLLNIEKLTLPIAQIEEVYEFLRNVGSKGFEGVALLAGTVSENRAIIDTTLIPKQTSYSIEYGLLYAVDEDELHNINVWTYSHKKTLIVQIHSHPGRAYHSDTDDKYPIIAVAGGVSIVVPNFASGDISLSEWAIYRLFPNVGWEEIKGSDKSSLIQIIY